jgi:type VI secretion system protein ImpL
VASARFTQGSGNAITALTQFAANKPEPVKRWLEKLSDQSWRIVLSAAHQHVNNEWKNQVYTFYKTALAGRYPLSRKSNNELAQLDFTDFFKPEGKMDKFFLKYIKPFANTGSRWSNRVVDNRSLGLNATTLTQIHNAQKIKNIFFRASPEAPGLSFELKPYRLDKIDARFWLDVGDQRIGYNHGPKFWKSLKWSAKDENSRVRIVFEDLNGDHNEISFEGPWAWLHMQDISRITRTKKANVYLIEYKVVEKPGNGAKVITHKMEYLIKAKSINNPFNTNLLASFNCPESI